LGYYRQLAVCDYRKTFQKLSLPVLSLLSRQGYHSYQMEEFAALKPDPDWIWFENSGHMPFWEEAEAFNALLRERFAR